VSDSGFNPSFNSKDFYEDSAFLLDYDLNGPISMRDFPVERGGFVDLIILNWGYLLLNKYVYEDMIVMRKCYCNAIAVMSKSVKSID